MLVANHSFEDQQGLFVYQSDLKRNGLSHCRDGWMWNGPKLLGSPPHRQSKNFPGRGGLKKRTHHIEHRGYKQQPYARAGRCLWSCQQGLRSRRNRRKAKDRHPRPRERKGQANGGGWIQSNPGEAVVLPLEGGNRDGGGCGGLVERIANPMKCRGQSRARTKFNLNCFAPLQG